MSMDCARRRLGHGNKVGESKSVDDKPIPMERVIRLANDDKPKPVVERN